MKTTQTQSRRTFLKTTALGMTALSASRVFGANERVNVGMIGFGLIGQVHTHSFKEQEDVEIRGVSDAFAPRMDQCAELIGSRCAKFGDFRRMLESKDIDAVVVATPDHWHALMTMMACAAEKDVYVEKPLTLFQREGQWMKEVARRTKRIVQVGVQNRSGPNFQRAGERLRSGRIGEIVAIQNTFMRNVSPGFGKPADCPPPEGLDYDMFLGPAAKKPYNPNRSLYHFRWFWDFSGGQMTNLGQHSLDLINFFLGVKAPKAVYSTGGRFFLKDNCEVPDTQDAIIEYPGFNAVCQYREASAGRKGLGMGGLVFNGTKGSLSTGRTGYEITADPKVNPINAVAKVLPVPHPVGGPQAVPDQEAGQSWTEPEVDESGEALKDYRRHARNFLDCVKSRKTPIADLESAHQVVTACHLANISLRTGRKLVWNADKETIADDREANRMLLREYRAPWDKELKALIRS
jgi:predicted dehydrogenase